MSEIEIIHTAIPLEDYELKITQLINTLLLIDEKLSEGDDQNPNCQEVA